MKRRLSWTPVVLPLGFAALGACGLAVTGTRNEQGAPGASIDGGVIVSGDALSLPAETGADADGGGTSCETLPAGWSRVGVASDPTTTCPAGTQAADLVDHAAAAADACSCSCDIARHQSCAAGDFADYYDDGSGKCAIGATPFVNAPAGQCVDQGAYQIDGRFRATPAPPSGSSACSGVPAADKTKVTKTMVRTCTLDAQAACAGAPFADCVVARSEQACPAGPYSTRRVLWTDVDVTCGACGACSVTTTCKGVIVMSSSSNCSGGVTVPVDDGCYPVPTTENLRYSKYTGTVASESCVFAPASPVATASPRGAQTLCCR